MNTENQSKNVDAVINSVRLKNTKQFIQEYTDKPINLKERYDKLPDVPDKPGTYVTGSILLFPGNVKMIITGSLVHKDKNYIGLLMISPYSKPAGKYELMLTSNDINIEVEEHAKPTYVLQMWNRLAVNQLKNMHLQKIGYLTKSGIESMQAIDAYLKNKADIDKSLLAQTGAEVNSECIKTYIDDSIHFKVKAYESCKKIEYINLYKFLKDVFETIKTSFKSVAYVYVGDNKITTKEFMKLAKKTELTFRNSNELNDLQIVSKDWWMIITEQVETPTVNEKYRFHLVPKTKIGRFCKRGTIKELIKEVDNKDESDGVTIEGNIIEKEITKDNEDSL